MASQVRRKSSYELCHLSVKLRREETQPGKEGGRVNLKERGNVREGGKREEKRVIIMRFLTRHNQRGLWLFPRLRGFWETVRPFIPRQHFFFKLGISSRTLIPLFMPGSVHSGSAS